MSKTKKTGKKGKAAGTRYKAPAFSGAARRAAGSATGKSARPPKKGPRSQPLPGMAKVRDGKLDNLCEAIGECRSTMNSAKQEEAGLLQSTLQRMVAKGVTVYKHAGVELARMPGAEKIRVRLTKDQGDAGELDLEAPAGRGETDNDQLGDERRQAIDELTGEGESGADVH